MNIFTIIVTYNSAAFIARCLNDLQKSSLPGRIIVVDNASTDNTVQEIISDFPSVILIQSPENLGFGLANNLGISKAIELNCDYVFLLNQDAFVNRNTIQQLVQCALDHPVFDIISPVHLNAGASDLDFAWKEYYISEKNCPGFISDAYLSSPKQIYEINFVNAAAWLLTPRCLKLVGGFNPYFFMYGEDVDYMNRTHAKGLKCGVCYQATITHERERPVRPESWNFESGKKAIYRGIFLRSETELMHIGKPFMALFFRVHFANWLAAFKKMLRFKWLEFFIFLLLEIKLMGRTLAHIKYRKRSVSNTFAYLEADDVSAKR